MPTKASNGNQPMVPTMQPLYELLQNANIDI